MSLHNLAGELRAALAAGATVDQIAETSGVSRATLFRLLSPEYPFSPRMRTYTAVRAAIDKLGTSEDGDPMVDIRLTVRASVARQIMDLVAKAG